MSPCPDPPWATFPDLPCPCVCSVRKLFTNDIWRILGISVTLNLNNLAAMFMSVMGHLVIKDGRYGELDDKWNMTICEQIQGASLFPTPARVPRLAHG